MTTAEHLERISRDGYTIVHDVFDATTAAKLRGEVDRLEAKLAIAPSGNDFEGTCTTRIYNLLAHGSMFEAIAINPLVLPIVDGILDPSCLVSSLSSITIGPGETAQPIHADDQVMPLAKPHAAIVCNSMWALTDFTEANGATRLIAGSHLALASPAYGQHYDSIPAEMPAGSVLIWHGSLWHGGGANTTDERRYGIAMNYCAGWVRQQENQQLGISLDVIAGFTPRLQDLCGFGIYRGLIGHIDKRSPAQRLFNASPTSGMLWDGR